MQTPTLWGNRAAGIMCISSIAKIELDLRFRSICVIVGLSVLHTPALRFL